MSDINYITPSQLETADIDKVNAVHTHLNGNPFTLIVTWDSGTRLWSCKHLRLDKPEVSTGRTAREAFDAWMAQ